MPLYEYFCTDCETKFEVLKPFAKADTAVECQECNGTHVRRLLSVFAARRSGDGEFGDGYSWDGPEASSGGCGCGGACSCGGH